MNNLKKFYSYVLLFTLAIVVISATFVFFPGAVNSGLTGTYTPIAYNNSPAFSRIVIKVNNKSRIYYPNGEVLEVPWHALCDSHKTSIYFVMAEGREWQFDVLENRNLKDLNHNGDIYSKK